MQYDPSFVMHRSILSTQDKTLLHNLSQDYPLHKFRSDSRNYEEMAVDFIYTSAKIEGNTYDQIDTDNLIRLGITAGGKRYSDAVMLINLRDAFDLVIKDEPRTLDHTYFCDLHKMLMKDLLPGNEQGIGRVSAVAIGATDYLPLSDATRLRSECKFILAQADRYNDAFEKAIYLHCNLAYLQYFRDGNKRTSRLMQTSALVSGGVMPLFFNHRLIDQYKRATVHYYETGEYGPYVSFFKENYQLTINNLSGISSDKIIGHAEQFEELNTQALDSRNSDTKFPSPG